MKKIYIVAAKRTPFGHYRGLLKKLSATKLGEIALRAAIQQAHLKPKQIQAIFMGNVLSTGLGENMARQVALNAGLPKTSVATAINEVCGSSLKAVRLAQGQMELGDLGVVAVGGAESMTNAPKMIYPASSPKAGETAPTVFIDGLDDAFSGQPMGITAENVALKYHVSRQQMDLFSLHSHQKAVRAVQRGRFQQEIIPIRQGEHVLDHDESIRPDTSLSALAHLKPAFKKNGRITAGNSSPLSDGASMLILATEEKVKALNLHPIARLGHFAEAAFEPQLMGYTPYFAVHKLLRRAHTTIEDYDAFEINEAFAAQVVALERDFHLPPKKLNLHGGAIALGHPLGATGTRLVAAAINDLRDVKGRKALVTLCIGGGQALAYEIEREK